MTVDRYRRGRTLEEALAWRTRKTEACWLWIGATTDGGYGRLTYDGVFYRAHRAAYMLAKGPIPDGLVIDHLCRVPKCVNPDHLEAVTNQVNTLRGVSPAAQKAVATHCIRDHELAGENLYINPEGRRQCRTCMAFRNRRTRAAAKAAS